MRIMKALAGTTDGVDKKGKPFNKKKKGNLRYTAQFLQIPYHTFRGLLTVIHSKKSFFWYTGGSGRPRKHVLDKVERHWATCDETLRIQAGMSLRNRAAQISGMFNKRVSPYQLRQLYKECGITRQMAQSKLGPKVLPPHDVQLRELNTIKNIFVQFTEEGRMVMQFD